MLQWLSTDVGQMPEPQMNSDRETIAGAHSMIFESLNASKLLFCRVFEPPNCMRSAEKFLASLKPRGQAFQLREQAPMAVTVQDRSVL